MTGKAASLLVGCLCIAFVFVNGAIGATDLTNNQSSSGKQSPVIWARGDVEVNYGLTEEKIAHFAGAETPVGMTKAGMNETIDLAGFIPKERDGNFTFKLN